MSGLVFSTRQPRSAIKPLQKPRGVIQATANAGVRSLDGNRFQLDHLQLAAADYGVDLTIVLDLIHVTEYLWQAAWRRHQEGDAAAEAWVSQRRLEILRGHSSQVAAGMRRSATLRGLSEKERAPLDRCANYLLKYRAYLRYDE